MATQLLETGALNTILSSKPTIQQNQHHQNQVVFPLPISRRCALLVSVLPLSLISFSPPSQARERRGRKVIPPEDYKTSADGLKYYDFVEGRGPRAEKGSIVQVHFDCIYRSIDAVSSRESKILAGNRIIAQRTVIVPPEAGYGSKGMNEIPPGATFQLDVELLRVYPSESK